MAITINTGSTTIPADASQVYGMAYKFAKQIIVCLLNCTLIVSV